MLTGMGANFLYAGISSCKAAFRKKGRARSRCRRSHIAIPIYRRTSTWLMGVWIGALSALSLFSRASAGLLTGALRSS